MTLRPCGFHDPHRRQPLAHWTQPERERRLFFCQIEAAETVIWLVEVRGDRKLGFAIPFTCAGAGQHFYPDFLVRLANGATLVLEVKGYADEQDRAKYAAAHRWCEAVSNWGQMGPWVFDHCAGPGSVKAVLGRHSR